MDDFRGNSRIKRRMCHGILLLGLNHQKKFLGIVSSSNSLKIMKKPLLMEIASTKPSGEEEKKIPAPVSENWRKKYGFLEDTFGSFIRLVLFLFKVILSACSIEFAVVF
jgi:hypothetical protein